MEDFTSDQTTKNAPHPAPGWVCTVVVPYGGEPAKIHPEVEEVSDADLPDELRSVLNALSKLSGEASQPPVIATHAIRKGIECGLVVECGYVDSGWENAMELKRGMKIYFPHDRCVEIQGYKYVQMTSIISFENE